MPRKRATSKKTTTIRVGKGKRYAYTRRDGIKVRSHYKKIKKFPSHYFTWVLDRNGEKRLAEVWVKKGKRTYRLVEDKRKAKLIKQPRAVKNYFPYQRTMEKEIPDNIAKGFKEMAKNPREYSIAVDFERKIEQPQRIAIIEGGKTETLRISDFELYGHTHPNEVTPGPSTADLRNMKYLTPEFIVAGKSGKIIILNIEDKQKYEKWREQKYHEKGATCPYNYSDYQRILRWKKYKNDKEAKNVSYFNLLGSKKGREMFFDITGVKVYPYRKTTKIETVDDPRLEKRMPSFPQRYLRKYHAK